MSGAHDEAVTESKELLAAADATGNPNQVAWTLFAYDAANREVAPKAACEAFRRGMRIAEDSGNLQTASSLASMLTTCHQSR
jgi:hypothetical protein